MKNVAFIEQVQTEVCDNGSFLNLLTEAAGRRRGSGKEGREAAPLLSLAVLPQMRLFTVSSFCSEKLFVREHYGCARPEVCASSQSQGL